MNKRHRALLFSTAAMQYLGPWWLSLAGVAGVAAISANAAALLPPSTFAQCSADGNSSFNLTACELGGFPGVPSWARATTGLSPAPFVDVAATSPQNGVFGAGTSATLLYRFQVTGGNVNDVVPILIDLNLNAFSTPESSALARVLIYTSALGVTHQEEVCTGEECEENSLSTTLELLALSGATLDSVTLYAQASATATHSTNEFASAFADPFIYVDPAFPNASLYSIVVSPGVGNVPLEPAQVPEPATLWLVGSVLFTLSLLKRRH
jgi:hypothetical protein